MKFYHGSKELLGEGPLAAGGRTWTAFDRSEVQKPFWMSPSPAFAKLNGPYVYECLVKVSAEHIFGERPYTGSGRYWNDMAINEGRLLYDALKNRELFADAPDFEDVFRSLISEDYDLVETREFIGWAKRNGFRAAYVQGDGERNLMVFNPSDVVIWSKVS